MWEWVVDWYDESWYSQVAYADGGSSCNNCANLSPSRSSRVIRGSCWFNDSYYLRAASRFSYPPTSRDGFGFGARGRRRKFAIYSRSPSGRRCGS